MIEIAIGLVGFACGFVASAVFAAQASRNAAEREAELQAQLERKAKEFDGFRAWSTTISDNLFAEESLNDFLQKEVQSLREAEAKRIAHLRSIASSGGKAKAAKRKA